MSGSLPAWWWGAAQRKVRELLMMWDANLPSPAGAAEYDHPDVRAHYLGVVRDLKAMGPRDLM